MEKTIRLGVIGCGNAFRKLHLPTLSARQDVEIIAACDSVAERCANIGAKRVYTDYRELLAQDDIDAVDICMPTFLHKPMILAALRAGKHVLCEKPDALNPAELEEIMEAERTSGRILSVIRNNRFLESSQFLKAQTDAGKLGEIYHARCGWIRRRGIPGRGGWITTKEKAGGGALIDLGIHMIDLAVWLMGNPCPVSVSGATYRKFADNDALADSEHAAFGEKKENGIFDVEDLATGFVRFDNGATLQIECSWASNIDRETRYVDLLGSRAGAQWRDGTLTIYSQMGKHVADIMPRFGEEDNGHSENIEHFLECLHGNVLPSYRSRQGWDVMRIIDGLYRSAEAGKEIALNPQTTRI